MILYISGVKPILEFSLSLTGLIIASPVFVVVTVLLAFANNGKPFFFQHRPGKNGRVFRIVKFKTMNDKCDATGNLLPDAGRLTPMYGFARSAFYSRGNHFQLQYLCLTSGS